MPINSASRLTRSIAVCVAAIVAAGCERREQAHQPGASANSGKIEITSTAFNDGGAIPPEHTCQGKDSSPALKWSGLPNQTRSIAVTCDDPDAPGGAWVHWVLYNVPAATGGLGAAIATTASLPDGSAQGKNDFGRIGYGGPCPPAGPAHHYYFRVYALDTDLAFKSGATKRELEDAMRGHVVAEGALIGTYARR
ncbi:MAG TPA: YbhB/YbcL family Raf kinase inhibitor-like protein [Blastocatellia bacterium]|nr:YbhB/YbcL family Raf kinase inhibitor-like protein [Blastocatellia bacterium]